MTKQEKIRYDLLILHEELDATVFNLKEYKDDIKSQLEYFAMASVHPPEILVRCEFVIDNKKHIHIGTSFNVSVSVLEFEEMPNTLQVMYLLFGKNQQFKITRKFLSMIKFIFKETKDLKKRMIDNNSFDIQSRKQILKTLKKNKGKMCRFNVVRIPYEND
ncbi:hypothetical protein KY334_03375 [Candidatus Woesearchaeota archaeon]|nr:hypothetical protein [Candidatus Woesearchaeota archaeon]